MILSVICLILTLTLFSLFVCVDVLVLLLVVSRVVASTRGLPETVALIDPEMVVSETDPELALDSAEMTVLIDQSKQVLMLLLQNADVRISQLIKLPLLKIRGGKSN